MELTGKCKEDFEKWLNFNENGNTKDRFNHWLGWNRLTDSMQWGVFEDFFATHDIYFQRWSTFYKDGINQEWQILIYDNTDEYLHGDESTAQYGDNHEYPTPMEARLAVIKKANKIYNGKEI